MRRRDSGIVRRVRRRQLRLSPRGRRVTSGGGGGRARVPNAHPTARRAQAVVFPDRLIQAIHRFAASSKRGQAVGLDAVMKSADRSGGQQVYSHPGDRGASLKTPSARSAGSHPAELRPLSTSASLGAVRRRGARVRWTRRSARPRIYEGDGKELQTRAYPAPTKQYGARSVGFAGCLKIEAANSVSSPRRRGPIRGVLPMVHGIWVPGLALRARPGRQLEFGSRACDGQ